MHPLRFNRLPPEELLPAAREELAALGTHAWAAPLARAAESLEAAREQEVAVRRRLHEARDLRRDDEDSLRQLLATLAADVPSLPADLRPGTLLDLPSLALAERVPAVSSWMRAQGGLDARRVKALEARGTGLREHALDEETALRALEKAHAAALRAEEELRRRLAATSYVNRG